MAISPIAVALSPIPKAIGGDVVADAASTR